MLLQYLAKKFGELVGKGLPGSVITEFLVLSVPFTVAMTLPMAVLVATLYAFSRLAAENEITAMKASGIGMRDVLGPVLLGGLGMSLVMLAFNDQVLPRANHRLAVLQLDIFRTKPTFALREQVFNTIKEGQLSLRAGDIDEATGRMRDVTIYDLSNPTRRRTIYGATGDLKLAPNHKDLDLTLYNGVMMEVPNNRPSELTRLFYTRDRLRVKNVLNSFEESATGSISKGEREMSVCEMQAQLQGADYRIMQQRYERQMIEWDQVGRKGPKPELPKQQTAGRGLGKLYCSLLPLVTPKAAQAQAPPASKPNVVKNPADTAPPRGMVPNDLEGYKARLQESDFRVEEAKRERDRFDVEIQKKFSLAAACIIFVLIGAPIALRFPRGGVGLVIGVSFAIFGIYYVGLIGGEALADKGYLPPWLAMWAANILLSMAGLVLAARMGSESATTRGGDWAELLATARTKSLGWMRRVGLPVERRRR
jgi:lipopolysaccharide export system permease protein